MPWEIRRTPRDPWWLWICGILLVIAVMIFGLFLSHSGVIR